MEEVNAGRIRQMMRLAEILRSHTAETNDPYYTEIFLRTADAIAQQAQALIEGRTDRAGRPIDVRC